MALLGSVLVDKEMMATVSEIVRPEDFYASLHETIFLALFALNERGEPLDKISLAEELRSRGMLDKVGGIAVSVVADGHRRDCGVGRVLCQDRAREVVAARLDPRRHADQQARLRSRRRCARRARFERTDRLRSHQSRNRAQFRAGGRSAAGCLPGPRAALRAQGRPHRRHQRLPTTSTTTRPAGSRATWSSSPRGRRWEKRRWRSTWPSPRRKTSGSRSRSSRSR